MYNSEIISERIKSVAKNKKIPLGKMLSDCELSKNTLSSMQSGGFLPRIDTICKIADYLETSVDYLLGRTEKALIDDTMSAEELLLVTAYKAKPEMQAAVRRLLEIPEPIDTNITDNDIADDMVKTVNSLSKSTVTKL